MTGGAAAKRLRNFAILGLALAGVLGSGVLRVGVAAHRGAVLPPARAVVADQASDVEGSVSIWPAPALDRPGIPPGAGARSHVGLHAVLDALQSVRRSSVTQISLPPPSPA